MHPSPLTSGPSFSPRISSDDNSRAWTRRAVLAAAATSGLSFLAGCSDSANRAATQPTGTPTAAALSESSTSDDPDSTFTAIYTGSFDSDATVLSADQRNQYADPTQFETTSHLLEAVTETVVATAIPESQELTRYLKYAIHNNLGYSPDEIRVLGRNTARGNTYTAIFHRQAGDWSKALTLLAQGDHGYRCMTMLPPRTVTAQPDIWMPSGPPMTRSRPPQLPIQHSRPLPGESRGGPNPAGVRLD